ncbi:NitT/TauT family transport system ATP-binding protein [Hathewaya proteolytica DSM 3090]|uniref:NitT/TauT family transport system ATP-binding protein n=1 Tax=Hathewaya proteolytica DSM 3090 TaxID=1121331 RepID=A0A1M6SP03_9CLOT|nr:ABC transporter ATP-binding protein [Hathewaya proteolytica]SHK46377.1 NitT/TauT family transport system ATP-binding protein [Hathewaya proteolytica DSM 3090]
MLDVSIKNVSFSYDKEPVLGSIDLDVSAGDFVCLLGQSGCGKSTLLRLIAGLEKPNSGEILIHGNTIKGPGLDRGMIFQDYGLFPWMTSGENIALALKQKFKTMNKSERENLAKQWMANVGLEESLFDKLPLSLSGGQRQRCAIARAFAIDPPVLLMDEPFGALDAVTKALLQDTVLELWAKEEEKRKTIFFVTHSVDEALLLATDIFVLGQSPSKIIYHHSFKGKEKPKRETMFSNPEVMEIRNKLIKIINDEIQSKAEAKKK